MHALPLFLSALFVGSFAAVSISTVGNSGQIKLFPSGKEDSAGANFVQIKQSKLAEADANGNVDSQRSINFASTSGSWSDLSSVTVNGTTYSATTYSSTFPVGKGAQPDGTATFELTAHLYQTPTTVPYGNTTITVEANTLKFSINVTGWPAFTSSDNTMVYAITVSTKGGNNDGKLSNNGTNNKQVGFDGASMDIPTIAILDGVSKDVDVSLDTKGSASTISFSFPSFSQSLYYDPTVTLASDSTSAATIPSAFFGMVVVLIALCL